MSNIEFRIGNGYDSHRFTENRPLIIGGVEIAYEKGLSGHSDADVLLHAISDALLGAAGLGDLGAHFPDTDPKWKNADSKVLLTTVYNLVRDKGYALVNLDATIIAEAPKFRPHINKIIQSISQILDIQPEFVSVKATTNEKMGWIGREEGIAVIANVLIRKES